MSDPQTSLTASRRASELAELADGQAVDLLVVGGGITGVGIALDAASRGLSVALLERTDLAGGTSQSSSRVIHGGTRYLATGGLGIAYESASERAALMRRIAPHLVRPLPMLTPELPDVPRKTRQLTRLGLRLGDVVRRTSGLGSAVMPKPRRVSAAEAGGLFEGLSRDGVTGAMLSFDAQLEDDVRLVIAVARTAADYGARILTRVEALKVGPDSVLARDALSGAEVKIGARMVVNATGVWAPALEPSLNVALRRGAHLLVPGDLLGNPRTALAVPVADRPEEVVFAVPQSDGLVLVGATDTAAASLKHTDVSADDVAFLLSTINRALAVELTEDDVVGRFAALRPVFDTQKHGDLERQHAIVVSESRLVTVIGGKLTTYRKMAQDAVDRAIAAGMMWAGECLTKELPLLGAASEHALDAVDADRRLVRRYGLEATEVLALADGHPELRERVVPQLPVIRAELVWGIRHELALTAEDLIDRRTRIGQTRYREQGLAVARRLLDMAPHRPVA
ncbi:glycerol-3-phosphate dehydrogenase/oxidase [Cumulibacter soli]|uniref:glycerol-3-phosphate dehydrogenase/oxidase n=1 Tax=Cumulibacter soli TaxID=2546344 RepID=UPI00106807A3|nr:glycerol-3-phosphate dehydrogenase/oxidase [Cumulibacter soli]